MVPATIFTVAGLISFGYAVQNAVSVYLIAFIWGMTLFGITIAAIATSSYALDAFRDHANEIFIMAMVFKNFFFYGLSNFINNWFAADGPTEAFNVMGGISAALVSPFFTEPRTDFLVPYFHSHVHLREEIPGLLAQIQCPQDAPLGNRPIQASSWSLEKIADIFGCILEELYSVA
jgi:hypothetical protein